jgi:hypothetical protein
MNTSPVPPSQGISFPNRITQASTSHGNQDRAEPNTKLRDMDLRPKLEAKRANVVILDPSKHVTVSAETRARWELLRALAGVQKPADTQTPMLEASVRNPTQISGPHPYEIVAAQVLHASTAPSSNEPSHASAVIGIGRRNASHGRCPQPPGASSLNQSQGGSHKLRPLMLPRMVSRSNSGRRAGSSGHVPIVRPWTVPERQQDGTPDPPWQQEASRQSHQRYSSEQSGIQIPKPLQPSSQIPSGLASGLSAASQVPSASPRPVAVCPPPASTLQFNDRGLSATGRLKDGIQQSTIQYHQGRPKTARKIVDPETMISASASNEHNSQRATPKVHLPNSSDTSVTPATPIADKSPEEVLILLANGDPDVLVFIYTDEGVEWLTNSKYHRNLLSVNDLYLLLTPRQCFFTVQFFWRSCG